MLLCFMLIYTKYFLRVVHFCALWETHCIWGTLHPSKACSWSMKIQAERRKRREIPVDGFTAISLYFPHCCKDVVVFKRQ